MKNSNRATLVRLLLSAVVCLQGRALFAAPISPEESADRRVYCVAKKGYRYEFPQDHFSHPCFRTEWWYFTGNLSNADGRRFGYQ